jgi:MerR family redox-sensitive transcriptional activator SoxR
VGAGSSQSISIGAVAARAGLATSAIRYYEAIGLLPQAERIGGRRVYDESVLARLAVIDLAKRAGFSLDEVKTLFAGVGRHKTFNRQWKLMARRKLDELDELIAEAERTKAMLRDGLACPCTSVAECRLLAGTTGT